MKPINWNSHRTFTSSKDQILCQVWLDYKTPLTCHCFLSLHGTTGAGQNTILQKIYFEWDRRSGTRRYHYEEFTDDEDYEDDEGSEYSEYDEDDEYDEDNEYDEDYEDRVQLIPNHTGNDLYRLFSNMPCGVSGVRRVGEACKQSVPLSEVIWAENGHYILTSVFGY